ncbi:MAG: hypothetical protein JJE39_15585 [Vicinamibacteria bacterium]|nr:hypothetical protein [Vicinamibacteria bacterium]
MIVPLVGYLDRDFIFRTTLRGAKAARPQNAGYFLNVVVFTSDGVPDKKVGTGSEDFRLGGLHL